jgi:hypothetical protein
VGNGQNLYDLDDETGQMPYGQPVVHRWRQKEKGFPIYLVDMYRS